MEQVYNRIRTAWDSRVPSALDRVAEQLAEEGVDESVILSEMTRLLLEVRAAGGDDETEDQITDVLDRLVGWCHESREIKTKRIEP